MLSADTARVGGNDGTQLLQEGLVLRRDGPENDQALTFP